MTHLKRFQAQLDHYCTTHFTDHHLHPVCQYALQSGGKRMRPLWVYATAEAVSGTMDCADVFALAIEFIHTFSLIHDDLPAMDDDDLRRGKPTCHKAFSEDVAILAGDDLQIRALDLILTANILDDATRLSAARIITQASLHMIQGQAIDCQGTVDTLESLERLHQLKTGALITASVTLGALTAPTLCDTDKQLLKTFSAHVGLAFQIQDDLLDPHAILGKTAGKDAMLGKCTYLSLLGEQAAHERLEAVFKTAYHTLEKCSASIDPTPLIQLLTQLSTRLN